MSIITNKSKKEKIKLREGDLFFKNFGRLNKLNKIHKEGWEAGYKKGRAETVEEIRNKINLLAVEGANDEQEWKGAMLLTRINNYLSSLTQKGQKK